jgi:hypothetical protein
MVLKEIAKVSTSSFDQALQVVAMHLTVEVNKALSVFIYDDSVKQSFLDTAREILRGAEPSQKEYTWDHNFFFVEDHQSHAVCGVALRQLAALVRSQKEDPFLDAVFIDSCKMESNRFVQAFRAEQIVISAINQHGFTVDKVTYSNVNSKHFLKVTELALGSLETGVHHFMPPVGFQFVDSLMFVVPSNKKKEVVKIFAQQTTFQSVANHAHSRDFFDEAYKQWQFEGKGVKFEWHLLWVLSKQEKDKQHKKKSAHGQFVKAKPCHFHEWFFSFADFEPKLNV